MCLPTLIASYLLDIWGHSDGGFWPDYSQA